MEKTSVSASERCLAVVLGTIRLVVLVTVNHFTVAPTGLLTPVALGLRIRQQGSTLDQCR